MIAPFWKGSLSPEVEAVDRAMREIHRTLMRLVAVFARDGGRHWVSTSDHSSMRAAKRKEVGLRDGWVKVVAGEWTTADPYVDRTAAPRQLHGLIAPLGDRQPRVTRRQQVQQHQQSSCHGALAHRAAREVPYGGCGRRRRHTAPFIRF